METSLRLNWYAKTALSSNLHLESWAHSCWSTVLNATLRSRTWSRCASVRSGDSKDWPLLVRAEVSEPGNVGVVEARQEFSESAPGPPALGEIATDIVRRGAADSLPIVDMAPFEPFNTSRKH